MARHARRHATSVNSGSLPAMTREIVCRGPHQPAHGSLSHHAVRSHHRTGRRG
jgi:hypothetical protein